MPFNETVAVQAQVLRAIVSANLSLQAMGDLEMLKLFGMLHMAAPRIIPCRKFGTILTGKDLGLSSDCNDTRTICSTYFGIVGLRDGNISRKMP